MTSFYSWRLFFLTFEGARALGVRMAPRRHGRRSDHEGVAHDEHSRDVEPASHADHEHGAHGDHTPA